MWPHEGSSDKRSWCWGGGTAEDDRDGWTMCVSPSSLFISWVVHVSILHSLCIRRRRCAVRCVVRPLAALQTSLKARKHWTPPRSSRNVSGPFSLSLKTGEWHSTSAATNPWFDYLLFTSHWFISPSLYHEVCIQLHFSVVWVHSSTLSSDSFSGGLVLLHYYICTCFWPWTWPVAELQWEALK